MANGFGAAPNPAGMLPGTSSSVGYSYQNMMSVAQDSYANVMSGYADLKGQIANTLGYGGRPWGVAAPAAQSIADTLAQQQGKTTQGLINSGLGNSTIMGSMQAGNTLQAQKAYASLGAQLAQTYAGYQGQVGLAQLAYQGAYHPFSSGYSQQQSQARQPMSGYGGGFGGVTGGTGSDLLTRGYNPGYTNAYAPSERWGRADQPYTGGGHEPSGAGPDRAGTGYTGAPTYQSMPMPIQPLDYGNVGDPEYTTPGGYYNQTPLDYSTAPDYSSGGGEW